MLEGVFGKEKGHQVQRDIENYLENKFDIHRLANHTYSTPEGFPVMFVVSYFPPVPKSTLQLTNDMDSWSDKGHSAPISRRYEQQGLKSRIVELSHYQDRAEVTFYFKNEDVCRQFIEESSRVGAVSRQRQIELGYQIKAKVYTKV